MPLPIKNKERMIPKLVAWSDFLTDTPGLPYEESVARVIVTASFRFNKTPKEVIKQTCDEGLEGLFPLAVEEL